MAITVYRATNNIGEIEKSNLLGIFCQFSTLKTQSTKNGVNKFEFSFSLPILPEI